MDVAGWLRGLGLEQYAPAFRDNDIDGEVLRHRQLVTSGQLNCVTDNELKIYCQHTLQISAQILNFWVLEALCSAAVT